MKYLVKDHPGLYRDPNSKAIVSEDTDAYKKYINEKKFREKSVHLENEINIMKSDIHEIKNLLKELLKR